MWGFSKTKAHRLKKKKFMETLQRIVHAYNNHKISYLLFKRLKIVLFVNKKYLKA